MVVNVVEAKSKLSSLLSLVGMGDNEVVIARRDKPMAVLVSYERFVKMQKQLTQSVKPEEISTLPTSLDKYRGIVAEDEIDYGYKANREAYLKEKYQ